MSRITSSILGIIITIFTFSGIAQDGEKAFRFLELPTSTRINALGGTNVSIIENDISLVFDNPAALGKEMNMHANIGFMSYIADIKVGSAIFGKSIRDQNAFAIGVNYIDYGKLSEGTSEGVIGDFSATDIAVNGVYSHMLTDRLRGGVTAKFIYSSYESYTSTAIGFDVGLSYYDEEREFSAGLVLKNIGSQISSYNDKRIGMPWDINVGLSKKLNNAPIRFSLTGVYLTQWDFSRIDEANGIVSDDGFAKTLFKHTVLGVDIIPSQNFWIALGFNPKAHYDLKLQEGNKFGGFNAGAGINISKFSIGFSLAKYHPDATSFHLSLSADISKF
ncbi:MAG: type IX secretion system protein PorQ [Dysgonomonas sp.]|nr:type IX secretion system protein PorQ [Dysgonomonas sp.]